MLKQETTTELVLVNGDQLTMGDVVSQLNAKDTLHEEGLYVPFHAVEFAVVNSTIEEEPVIDAVCGGENPSDPCDGYYVFYRFEDDYVWKQMENGGTITASSQFGTFIATDDPNPDFSADQFASNSFLMTAEASDPSAVMEFENSASEAYPANFYDATFSTGEFVLTLTINDECVFSSQVSISS